MSQFFLYSITIALTLTLSTEHKHKVVGRIDNSGFGRPIHKITGPLTEPTLVYMLSCLIVHHMDQQSRTVHVLKNSSALSEGSSRKADVYSCSIMAVKIHEIKHIILKSRDVCNSAAH